MKDNFSKHAQEYARYRPAYPPELFSFINEHVHNRKTAWDCATGNGQTARALANHFEQVYATDISQKQIDQATAAPNIHYSVQPAENTSFAGDMFDLVTISQALHWIRTEEFYKEVVRVSRPGGWIAAWMYSLPQISPKIDELISVKLYKEILGEWWDAERRYVDENYATIPFPFREINCPVFYIRYEWTIGELEGYLNTWSALQKFVSVSGHNPVNGVIHDISAEWGQEQNKTVLFPVHMRMGKTGK
jgi:SAM-dependent methyltransferase